MNKGNLSENVALLKSKDVGHESTTDGGDDPAVAMKPMPARQQMMMRQSSVRSMPRQMSSRNVLSRQDSGLSGNIKRQNSTDLLVGALDESEQTLTESSVGSASVVKTATTAALPESISWRVANSWKLVEDKLDYIGVEFFLSLFEEHPQAADLFRFGNHVMYLGTDKKLRHEKAPKSLRVHARKVMDAVGLCVQGIDHIPDLIPTLRTLGTMHLSIGVQDFHYAVVFKHLMKAIEEEVGSKLFDKDTQEAWEIAFRSLTNVMKHPEAVLQIEPLEGWGVVNTIACGYFVIASPFQMAGLTLHNPKFNFVLSFFTTLSAIVLTFDMLSHWIAKQVQPQASSNHAKRSPLRRKIDILIFPVQFRVIRFLRSLKMDRWTKWHGMESIILASFPLQQLGTLFSSTCDAGSVAVHWTYMFGLLRLYAASRVLHSLTCAENNLMLRQRQIGAQQLLAMRMMKLIFTMLIVIHINACLWCIVARVGFGFSGATEPKPTDFFPKAEIFTGELNPANSYLHAVHWAWVCLAGIGDTDSNPETSLECVVTLFVHICGATLYTITTGNVVAILEAMTEQQNEAGNDLAELGHFLQECSVPQDTQKRIMQGYMMQQMMGGEEEDKNVTRTSNRAPEAPDAVARLPTHLRHEMATYLRSEAMRRRDRGFAHCSHEFLVAFVGALKNRMILMIDDDYVLEGESVPNQVALIVDGSMEILWNDRVLKRLQVGDMIGKHWIVPTGKKAQKMGIRAESICTLMTGLSSKKEVEALRERFPRDFSLLKANKGSLMS